MKHSFIKTFTLFVCAIILLGCQSTSTATEEFVPQDLGQGYQTYQNTEASFQIQYPENWIVDETSDSNFVSFDAPPEDLEAGKHASIFVSGGENSPSLNEVANQIEASLQDTFDELKDFEIRDVSLAGNPAKEFTYTYTLEDQTFKTTQTTTVINGFGYIVNLLTDPESYTEHSSMYQNILTTFAPLSDTTEEN